MNTLSLFLQEGPNASLSWLLWIVLGLFLLIVVIGWLVSRGRRSEPAVSEPEIAEETYEDKKPLDDLTELEGIGPKVAQVLHRAGIESFADLAQADPARLEEALRAAGMQMMDPRGWIEQAKLAADHDREGLARLQQELRGGRRVS